MPLPSNGSMDQCVSRLNRNQEHEGADLITQLRVEVDVQTERADELADECELLKIMNREGVRALAKLKAIEAALMKYPDSGLSFVVRRILRGDEP